MDFLSNLFRGVLFIILTLVGLGIAFLLLVFGLFTLIAMYFMSLFRGKQFSAASYWQQSRARAQQTRSKFNARFQQPNYSRRPQQEVSDAEIREIK
ncbi:hypothetical protein F9B74_07045 [Pelistega sp. NLN82]|uniref:Uncharacterized protein n=1 Tax=Pelistega ratti TaxID=2652177 RepID=A0A6L9Y6X2_9BURK|nr:hypothetical protein [Pelistega ratti]NEN76076.1 hypothetical protein [Pelistega ratti]